MIDGLFEHIGYTTALVFSTTIKYNSSSNQKKIKN